MHFMYNNVKYKPVSYFQCQWLLLLFVLAQLIVSWVSVTVVTTTDEQNVRTP